MLISGYTSPWDLLREELNQRKEEGFLIPGELTAEFDGLDPEKDAWNEAAIAGLYAKLEACRRDPAFPFEEPNGLDEIRACRPERRKLPELRLSDDELLHGFFQKIIDTVTLEGNYLILMGCDSYDVPFKGKDDISDADKSEEVYTYLICAICPVKQTKANLHYVPEEKLFHDGAMNQPVSAPALGFLFPAFDNRSTNIYNALYYTHDIKVSQDALIEALFNTPVPMPAAEQKKCFEALLTTALGEDCNLDVVQTVHDQLCERIELHKEAKVAEPLLIAKADVKETLASCGVSEEHLAKWSVDYDETFGFEADLHPKNIIDTKRFEVKTPDVSIKVDPTRSDLIETRTIGGVKYIMICADENVEVNGVSIHIDEEKEAAKI